MSTKKQSLLLFLSFIAFFSTPVFADPFIPSHSCNKPYKPFEFTSQFQVDQFNEDVKHYQNCINDFIEEQQSEIGKHHQGINRAIEDWNQFVQMELN